MLQRMTFKNFIDAFQGYKSFSHSGLSALFEHLEDTDADTYFSLDDIRGIYKEYKDIEDYNRFNGTNHSSSVGIDHVIVITDETGWYNSYLDGFIVGGY